MVRSNGLSYAVMHVEDYMLVSPFVTMVTCASDELEFRARYFSQYHTLASKREHLKLFPISWQQR